MFDNFDESAEGPRPEQANWQGWTPPWMGREGDGPQGPRGPFGPGHGPGFFGGPRGWGWRGPRGPFGPGFGFGFGWGHHGWHGKGGPFGPGWWGIPDELLALRSEAAEVARLFAIASRGAFENKERVSQLRSFLERSRKELSDMIYESGSSSGSTGTGGETPGGESSSGSSEVGQA